jgi:hypothetical protein
MEQFIAGRAYTRADVLRELGLDDPHGGAWYTGLTRHSEDHYIFCGVGVGGRTGHNYGNHFIGPDLVWRGRTDSSMRHQSIQSLCSGNGKVHSVMTIVGHLRMRDKAVRAIFAMLFRWRLLGRLKKTLVRTLNSRQMRFRHVGTFPRARSEASL